VQFEHQTDARGRHTFFVSPDRTTDYVVGMPPDGTLQGRAQRITVPVAGPAEKPAPPEQSIQIFMGARTHQPGAEPGPAWKAQAPVEVVAAPVQPGRGIQLFRQKLNAAGTPIGDWKEWRRTQQDGAGRAFMFVPVAAGGGRQWRYTAHSLPQGDYPRVSAVHHASEAANGWTEVFDDQFGGTALKPAKWGHRTPRPANLATLCAKTAEKRFRDFSDNSVTRVGGGVLQLDTRPVRRCRKGWEWVRATPTSAPAHRTRSPPTARTCSRRA
jgi:hypothetical protein